MAKAKVKMKYNLINDSGELKSTNIVFENALKVNQEEYVVVLSAMDLAKLYDEEKLYYNTSTQRGVKVKKTKDNELIEEPIHSSKNIKEMIDLIKEGSLCNSLITLVVPDDDEYITFEDGRLTINKQMSILDGFHRISSCYTVWCYYNILQTDEFKDILYNTKFTVSIGSYGDSKSKERFKQMCKGLKISKSREESFDLRTASNRIVNKLNRLSILKDRIDTTKTSITKNDTKHIYTFATLNEAIKNEFGIIQNEKEESEIYDFLELFFDELFKTFPEFLDDDARQMSKEYSLICENMTIYGYMAIAESLYLKRFGDWRSELANISKIDFDKESDVWQPIVRVNDDKIALVNNKQTRSILAKIMKSEFYKVQSL